MCAKWSSSQETEVASRPDEEYIMDTFLLLGAGVLAFLGFTLFGNSMNFKSEIQKAYASVISEFPDSNPFQPGFIREYILSSVLGHELIPGKKGRDAFDGDNDPVEYKTFKTGNWGMLNVEIAHGFEKHLTGTKNWYFAEFDTPFTIARIWVIPVKKVRKFCSDFMKRTSKTQGHVMINFSVKWIEENGDVVPFKPKKKDSLFIQHLRNAQEIAAKGNKDEDITLKGRIREILMAEILGHTIVSNSKLADAIDDAGNEFEYLTSLPPGNFQMTHMTEANSENKVLRNEAIYCALFQDPVTIAEMWRVETDDYMKKMATRRPWPTDRQNNFTVTLVWVKGVGTQCQI